MTTIGVKLKLFFVNKQFNAGIKKLKNNFKSLKEFKAIGAGVTAFGGALGGGLGMAVKHAATFEHSMKRVQALTGASTEDFNRLTGSARDLGRSTVFSASQVGEGMQFLAMAGFSVNQTLAAMPGLLNVAAAAQTDLGRASDITSNILTNFGISANETNRVADVLTKTFTTSNTTLEMLGETMKFVGSVASGVGWDLEQMAATAGLLGNAGIQAGMAGRALRMAIVRLVNPPKQASESLNELEIKTVDAAGKLKPLATIIEELSVAMIEMGDAEKQTHLARIFGTESLSAFMALLKIGPDRIREYTEELRNSAGTAAEIAEIQNSGLIGSLKKLRSGFEEAAIAIGNALIPTMQTLTGIIQSLVDWFNDLPKSVKENIAQITALTTAVLLIVGPVLTIIGFIPQIITGLTAIGSVVSSLVMLAAGLPALLNALGAAIVTMIALNWDEFANVGRNITRSIWNGVVDGEIWLRKNFLKFGALILKSVGNFITSIPDIGYNLVVQLWNGINSAAEWMHSNIMQFTESIINIISIAIQRPELGIKLVQSIWDGLGSTFNWLKDNLIKFGENLVETIKAVWTGRREIGLALIDSMWDGIEDGKEWLNTKISDLGKEIQKNLQNAFKFILSSGELKKANQEAIKDMENALKNSQLVDTARDVGQDMSNELIIAGHQAEEETHDAFDRVGKKLDKTYKIIGQNIRNAFDIMQDESLTWGQKVTKIIRKVLADLAKAYMMQQMMNLSKKKGVLGAIGKIGKSVLGSFSQGGVVPGNFSSPVPIMAHGSEMVINPTQQGKLWNMINNGNGAQAQTNPINVTYIINAQSASQREVAAIVEQSVKRAHEELPTVIQKSSNVRAALRQV